MNTVKKAPAKATEKKEMKIVKATAKVEKAPIVKKEEKQKIEVKIAPLLEQLRPSADERIKNAEHFGILTNKFNHLKEKNEGLKRFRLSSDGTKETIYLENAEGYKFEVRNSNIIDEVVGILQTKLNGLLKHSEEEIQNFVI